MKRDFRLMFSEGSSDSELADVVFNDMEKMYGYAHRVGHRSDLARGIYEGCQRHAENIQFFFSTNVQDISRFESHPSFLAVPKDQARRPYVVEADILLAADGVKSTSRVALLKELGVAAEVQDTGQAAYRIMLSREEMAQDPELLEVLDKGRITRWVGARRHIIAYPVSNKTIYNISTTQPDVNFAAAPSATYTTKGSKDALLEVYADFCPRIQKMLKLVPEGEVCEWKLRIHAPLPTWVHGCIALVGDACHPTLPHLNQGAAQAIEDAAVLAVVLSNMKDGGGSQAINEALKSYEKVRKSRAEELGELAAASGRAMHLAEGEAREERDRQFAAVKSGKGPVPDKWADSEVQRKIFGFDCVKAAEDLTRPFLRMVE